MFTATIAGDIGRVHELTAKNRGLLTCQFDYTSPIHFAVREGHFELVRFFVENLAFDPAAYVHPFMDTLTKVSENRGFEDITAFLNESAKDSARIVTLPDVGEIDWGKDRTQLEFEQRVDRGEHDEVEAMLRDRPDLALMETAFWGEGIMCMPAKGGDMKMLDILMSYGATVPKLSKWGARYYFKRFDTAEFLLKNGMDANHMNWREFTLLHDMGHKGFVDKAKLLLDFGANINAIDDEFSTTPLGYAAKWGNREVALLLIERGANVNKTGALWSTPLAWAERGGHMDIAADLRNAGAT